MLITDTPLATLAASPGPSPVVESAAALPLPEPRVPVSVRPATPADLPFIDSLQKRHAKQVGWMPMKSLEGKVAAGDVLIAEEEDLPQRHGSERNWRLPASDTEAGSNVERASVSPCLRGENLVGGAVGYVIATDRYMKREDCGIVYQLNVLPGRQRGLVGATLLRAQFARSAYGCRLYCCWCAQDIAANRFWEAMGFIPLAYRAGSRDKGRVHIFWQRRSRAGDETTPYWFPSQTTGGSIREDRLVFPIPPGTHWGEAKAVVLPEQSAECCVLSAEGENRKPKALPGKRQRPQHSVLVPPHSRDISSGGLRFPAPAAAPKPAEPDEPKREREPKRKVRNDPRLVAAARELRDRYLEHVNSGQLELESCAKYDIACRQLPEGPKQTRLLMNPRAA